MKVSIIICTHLEQAQPYLDLALKSLEKQTLKDFEVILVSSGEYLPITDSHVIKTHSHSDKRLHYPAAMVRGYGLTDPTSEYIFLMNDDAFLHEKCLQSLVEVQEVSTKEIVLNPLANCDAYGMFYYGKYGYFKQGELVHLPPKAKIEDIQPIATDIMERMFLYQPLLVPIPFCPFYATLMKRPTYDKVGGIHSEFLTGWDDSDFAMRARKHGVEFYAALHAGCFHFSGISADLVLTVEEREFNRELFLKRHKPVV